MKTLRICVFGLMLAHLARTQTAVYPGAVATDNQFKVVANNVQTTITFPVATSDTTIQVASSTGITANSVVTIDNEIMAVCAVPDGTHLTIGQTSCPNVNGRGFDTSTVATHSATGANCNPGTASGCVSLFIDAWHHNVTRVEVEAIEAALGANLSNVPGAASGPTVPINKGGTGQTTQSAALTAILGASTVPIANGGTGAATQPTALSAILGASVIPLANGGTGVTAAQGTGDSKVELAGTNSGVAGATLCNDANGGATTAACTPALPAATGQLQYLRIQPNTGNNTTTQFASLPTYAAADYNFPVQTPGGSLAIGNNGITMTPVPLGVNGSDTNHVLYVSAGTGTAESCLIVGGSGTSGQSSGSITINCQNTHTGAWTIQSADTGINEALRVASAAGGGTVWCTGVNLAYGQTVLPSNTRLTGSAGGCTVRVATNAWSATQAWVNPSNAAVWDVIATAATASYVTIDNLTVDYNAGNQTVTATQGALVALSNSLYSKVDKVSGINGPLQSQNVFVGIYGGSAAYNSVTNNSSTGAYTACTSPNGPGGIFVQGTDNIVSGNIVSNLCDEGYIANSNALRISFIGNKYIGHTNGTATAFHAEDSGNVQFIGNTIVASGGQFTGIAVISTGLAFAMNDIVIADNYLSGVGASNLASIEACGTATQPVRRLVISGNVITGGPYYGILVCNEVSELSIAGNTLYNLGTSGNVGCIEVVQLGGSSQTAQDISIVGNMIDQCGASGSTTATGIIVTSGSVTAALRDISILGNTIRDSGGTPFTNYAIQVTAGAAIVRNVGIAYNQFNNMTTAALNVSAAAFVAGYRPIVGPNFTDGTANSQFSATSTFANLGGFLQANSDQIFCSDCKNVGDGATAGAACVAAGTGAQAIRENGANRCF